MALRFTVHDDHPAADAARVGDGLDASNALAAPLHEVRELSCYAHGPAGELVGGAVGRRWGDGCELQALWVDAEHRRQGIGEGLVKRFEAEARARAAASPTSRPSASRRRRCTGGWAFTSPTRTATSRTAS